MKQAEKYEDKVRIVEVESGTSGTEIYSGYFQEEYLTELSGTRAADVYDKMRRNDSQIILALSAPINAILGGAWGVEAASSEDKDKEIADFVRFVFFEDLDRSFHEKLKEILTFITFGYSIFEVVHKIVTGHPQWGNYLGFKKLAFRSQKTIEKWNFIDKQLASITQMAYGDLKANIDLDIENLLVFTVNQEGDNYEGISMLRPVYGSWFRKQVYLKLDAIGTEKTALGTPKGKYPAGMYNTVEYVRFMNVLKRISSHQSNYISLPDVGNTDNGSWDIDVIKLDYDSQKVNVSIDREDKAILRAFVAGFLMLGQSGSTGSWSLSTDQSDFFLNGIVHLADIIAYKFKRLVNQIVDWKYGPQDAYPELTHQGIKDKAGEEWQRIVCAFKSAGLIKADDKLEEAIRQRYDLPEIDTDSVREEPAPINPFAPAPEKEEEEIEDAPEEEQEEKEVKKQSEKIVLSEVSKLNKKYSEVLAKIQDKHLKIISEDMIKQVVKKFENSTDAQEINSIGDIKIRKLGPYKKEMLAVLDDAAQSAQDGVEKIVKKKTNLSETLLAKKKPKLKKKTQKYNKVMASFHVTSQANDIYKAIGLQFGSSINSTKDTQIIESHIREASEKKITSVKNASKTTISQTVAKARENYFFDDEIKQEIESFTFRNDSPVSNICTSLNGKTFRSDDAGSYQFTPPLHHNCDSYLEPNFRAAKNNPKPEGLKPSASDQKDITLKEV